jgi:hypothetical protein
MKLTKKQLLVLLTEYMGGEESAISSQLDKLIADVSKSLAKGESYSINGFGTFSDNKGRVTFEVAPTFASEINYSYIGMQPVDVDSTTARSMEDAVQKTSKAKIKKPVVIVDEDVNGEEDPFGLPDNDALEFVDPAAFLEELEQESGVQAPTESDSKNISEEDEGFDSLESEDSTEVKLTPIDDEVDEEELKILDQFTDHSEDVNQDDDPFMLDDDAPSVISTFRMDSDELTGKPESPGDIESTDERVQVAEWGAASETLAGKLGEQTDSKSLAASLKEELAAGTDDLALLEPNRQVAEPSVLDEFFASDIKQELPEPAAVEGLVFDSDSEGNVTESEMEMLVQEEGGPRVISIEEAEKEETFSFAGLFKWVGIVLIISVVMGGVFWFFTGPGKSLITFSSAPTVVTIPPLPVVSSPVNQEIDQHVLPTDSAEAEDLLITDAQSAVSAELSTGAVANDMDESGNDDLAAISQPTRRSSSISTPSPTGPGSMTQESPSDIVQQGIYGLSGAEQDIQGTVFSIIVHSLPSRLSAQEQCNVITAMNLRCLVREALSPQGRPTYRVGIGQFASSEIAEAAAVDLMEPFRSRYFIARVN